MVRFKTSKPVVSAEIIKDVLTNFLHSHIRRDEETLFYIIESADWAIYWDGRYITSSINREGRMWASTTLRPWGVQNSVIHFGSVHTFTNESKNRLSRLAATNRIVVTWYHFEPDDPNIEFVQDAMDYVDIFHTSCSITRDKLLEIGIPERDVAVVPIGVDLNLFEPNPDAGAAVRQELDIPPEANVVGSFQKDDEGWNGSGEPKMIKGPDVLVEVADTLHREVEDLYVLLCGPSRNYVKRELTRLGVPHKHVIVDDYTDMPRYYNAIDLYAVTSRAEGGPKAVPESFATGTPLVSTRVGMAADLIEDGRNGYLVEVGDTQELARRAGTVLTDDNVKHQLRSAGLESAEQLGWELIADQYYESLYTS